MTAALVVDATIARFPWITEAINKGTTTVVFPVPPAPMIGRIPFGTLLAVKELLSLYDSALIKDFSNLGR